MRAMLLAAGYGTRLRPLTDTVPKCLVPIRGRPLLEIWLESLVLAGLGPFLINTHHLAHQVNHFISKSPYIEQIYTVYEQKLLGTAGTIKANLDFFGKQDGIVIHADNYCLADLQAFVRAHQNRPVKCLLTMMTFRTDSPSSCGIVELDDQGVVQGFYEKLHNPPGNLANAAIYVLSAQFLNLFYEKFYAAKNFSTDVLPHLMGKIYTFETTAPFVDIGTPETYHLAEKISRA